MRVDDLYFGGRYGNKYQHQHKTKKRPLGAQIVWQTPLHPQQINVAHITVNKEVAAARESKNSGGE